MSVSRANPCCPLDSFANTQGCSLPPRIEIGSGRRGDPPAEPGGSIAEARARAARCARQGEYDAAIAALNDAIASGSPQARDYNNRGLMYFYRGDLDAAIADFNRAIAIDEHLSQAYNNRGNAYARQGLLVEAAIDYDRALDLDPFNGRAWINQGMTLRDLEIYELALESFDFALALGEHAAIAYAERGRTYHELGDWNAAIADYRRSQAALDLDPSLDEGDRRRRSRQLDRALSQLLSPQPLGDEG